MHVRTVVGRKQGVIALTTLSTQIINGDVPEEARAWLYPHKLTMLLKESHHQANLEDRAKRALGQSTSTIRALPIAIGDALLRVAERAYTKSMGSA